MYRVRILASDATSGLSNTTDDYAYPVTIFPATQRFVWYLCVQKRDLIFDERLVALQYGSLKEVPSLAGRRTFLQRRNLGLETL